MKRSLDHSPLPCRDMATPRHSPSQGVQHIIQGEAMQRNRNSATEQTKPQRPMLRLRGEHPKWRLIHTLLWLHLGCGQGFQQVLHPGQATDITNDSEQLVATVEAAN